MALFSFSVSLSLSPSSVDLLRTFQSAFQSVQHLYYYCGNIFKHQTILMCRYLREKVQFEKRTLRSYWSGIIVHMQDRQEPDCNTDNAPAAAAFLSLFHQQCHPCGFLRNAKPVYPVTGDIKSLLTHVPRRVIQASCNITGKSSIWSFEPHAMNDASTASCAGTTATIFCCLFLVVSSLTCDCLFHIAIPLPNARSLFSTFSACEHVFHILCAWFQGLF